MQPTGHPAQTDCSTRAARSHLYAVSVSAPTGQTSMHAPQNSQPDSSSESPMTVPTSTWPARSVMPIATSPRNSSHARVQRAQTMQRL